MDWMPDNDLARVNPDDVLSQIYILVVEDDRVMRRLLMDMLKIMGFGNVHVEGDSKEALDYMAFNPVDIVICDWKMTPLDGIELTRHIRSRLSGGKRFVPIIMLTGKNEERDVLEARDAGITEYLVKPFTSNTLFDRIRAVVENPRGFVVSEQYVGPDRRRRNSRPPDGIKKRETD